MRLSGKAYEIKSGKYGFVQPSRLRSKKLIFLFVTEIFKQDVAVAPVLFHLDPQL